MFDLGGVLVRIRRDWPSLCDATGITRTAHSMRPDSVARRASALHEYQRGDLTLEQLLDAWRATAGLDLNHDECLALLEAIVADTYDGVLELVGELKALGLTVGCLSNTNAVHWRRMMKEFPVLGALHHRIASHEVNLSKPEREFFDHAAAALGIPPARIVLFDDLADNCDGARAAGWLARLIDHEGNTTAQMRHQLRALGVPVQEAA